MAGSSFSSTRKLAQAKSREYSIVSQFKLGYRNREDVTNLPPGVLIVGSQNVLTNVSERVQIRQGYSLDGAVSSVASPVSSSFDWLTKINGEVHLRAGGLTSAGNDGKLQYRYELNQVAQQQLVTNGSFTGSASGWTVGAGWTYGTNNMTTNAGGNLSQTIALIPGATYEISFDTTGGNNEALIVRLGSVSNATFFNIGVSATTTTLTLAAGTANSDITFINSGSLVCSFDNVSVKLVSNVQWRDLMTDLTSVAFNFTTFWRVDENLRVALFVDGSSNVYEWNGATAVTLSYTGNTITKTGTETWLDAGFYTTGDKIIVINGTQYTYTAGEDTLTLTGVTPDPTGEAIGEIAHQEVITTAISAFTDGPPSTFPAGLIRVLNNQIFLGSLVSSVLWISKVNDYTDYGSSTPRQSGEGATLILDSQLVGLEPQENFMYVTAGQDLWYNVNFELQTSTVGVTYEQVNALPLKTGRQQAAFSQAFLSHMKNNIIVVTNEPTVDTFGRVESSLATPQQTNISDPIKLDMDGYDFTDGSIFYWRYYILVAIPKAGVVRIFNLNTSSWEAPQTLPISRFYIVDGELYGHSYSTFESYKLFDGYADRVYAGFNGFPIPANWVFSYENYGSRFSFKKATKSYVEGYINANTTLNMAITYELDGCKTIKTFQLSGNDMQFVCISGAEGALGKSSLGKLKLGGDAAQSIQGLPPKFRWFPTFTNTDFFECSISFSVLGTDERMELLAFGLAVGGSNEIPVQNMN